MKKVLVFVLAIWMVLCCVPMQAAAEGEAELTVLFTHDIHDYLYPTTTVENGKTISYGGAARLATLVRENSDANTLFLDAGDFSMGTLYQAGFSTDACELRNLGLTGCTATTFGNHEFDYGAAGLAAMLRAAKKSGDPLPQIVQSNLDFSGELTADQKDLQAAMEECGVKPYTVIECGGHKVGLFGVLGIECIQCIQTDLAYFDYIEAAKSTVETLRKEGCDVVIALSHAGTDGDRKHGEDFDLAKQVPDIDLIVSGHSHSTFETPVFIGKTAVVCCGEYLKNLGKLRFTMQDGKLTVADYALLPLDSTVKEDVATAARMAQYRVSIAANYLRSEGVAFDEVLCHSDFTFTSLLQMYASHEEYPFGNLITDAYMYEAKKNGIDDVDVAIVGLGTVRGSFKAGDITTADAFEICSLGVGADGSAGHPLVVAYITGKELKLLTELDASLGPLEPSVKLSYSGLSYTFNTKRILLDRVTQVSLVREDGTTEPIEDKKLYKVIGNMYALNMLSVVSMRTKGLISVLPKFADGTQIENFYDASMKTKAGTEVKEWVALKDYLQSFPTGENGVPEMPEQYQAPLGRKNKTAESGWAVLSNPGTACKMIPTAFTVLLLLIVGIVLLVVFTHRKKKAE